MKLVTLPLSCIFPRSSLTLIQYNLVWSTLHTHPDKYDKDIGTSNSFQQRAIFSLFNVDRAKIRVHVVAIINCVVINETVYD